MISKLFALKVTKDNIEPILDFLKLVISLCSLFIGGLVFKSGNIEVDIFIKCAVGFSLSAIVFSLMAFAHLGIFKSSKNIYPNKRTSIYLYLGWQSFLFVTLALGAKFVL